MKIAITGGAGFIGTELAGLLKAAGHELVLIDIRTSQAFPDLVSLTDVRDFEKLKESLSGVEAIYHLAAEHRDDVHPISKYYDVNVAGGQNVINAAKVLGIKKIIFTSSVAVYPLEPANSKTGSIESDPAAPFNDYGHSKYQSEQTFQSWAKEDASRTLVITRLVATFGKNNRGNIYALINQIDSGKFVMIGDGSNCKSIAYVGNVVKFLQHVLTISTGTHLYNYADKPDLNMRDMVRDIREALGFKGTGPQIPYAAGLLGGRVFDIAAKITGRSFPISLIRVRKFCANTIVSSDKLLETRFTAPYSLREGLEEMIAAEFPQSQKAA
jgi:nucleoside-diphosphate-sugar epimerase